MKKYKHRVTSVEQAISEFPNYYIVDSITGCWHWNRGSLKGGKLLYCLRINGKLYTFMARRIAYQIKYGEDAILDKEIWNVCGNPVCVNPDHQIVNNSTERFWMSVRKNKETSCWDWIGDTDERGRGRIRVNGKGMKAPRFSWLLHHYSDPGDLDVCHKCDNPNCVNPEHLFLGTHMDNMKDMALKGRSPHREKYGKSPLTEEIIKEIRNRNNSGESLRELGREFDVSKTTIRNIITRKHWRWVE